MRKLSIKDFENMFNAPLGNKVKNEINKYNFGYTIPSKLQRDAIIIKILERISRTDLGITGEKTRWEKGWAENLKNFKQTGDIASLTPKYIRENEPIRLFDDYVLPNDPEFELNFFKVLRKWLFETYLNDIDEIFEFGCGPAHNLIELASMYPQKKLHGLEWVSPPLDIIKLLKNPNIQGHLFDMFAPDYSLEVPKNSAFVAFGALEQLGTKFENFLDFVLKKRPKIFVQIDPLMELWGNNLPDYLVRKYHQKRNYLAGYLNRLKEIKEIKIIKAERVGCGGLYNGGYSFVIWKV